MIVNKTHIIAPGNFPYISCYFSDCSEGYAGVGRPIKCNYGMYKESAFNLTENKLL